VRESYSDGMLLVGGKKVWTTCSGFRHRLRARQTDVQRGGAINRALQSAVRQKSVTDCDVNASTPNECCQCSAINPTGRSGGLPLAMECGSELPPLQEVH